MKGDTEDTATDDGPDRASSFVQNGEATGGSLEIDAPSNSTDNSESPKLDISEEKDFCQVSDSGIFARQSDPKQTDSGDTEKETGSDVIVLVCAFFGNVLWGLDLSGFGVFYPYLIEHFETKAASVGWCTSVNGFVQCITALFVSYPVETYGCRLPGLIGSLIVAVGFCLCCLAPNLETIYLLYGVIEGFGSGLFQISAHVVVQQRFKRNRTLAGGVVWLGFSLGGTFGSTVASSTVVAYGWRAAFLILGAVQANRIPLCLFFRSPEKFINRSKQAETSKTSAGTTCDVIIRYFRDSFDFQLLRKPSFGVYAFAHSAQLAGVVGYMPHAFNRALSVGLTRTQAVVAASLTNGVTLIARASVSLVANKTKANTSILFGFGMLLYTFSVVVLFVLPEIAATMTSVVVFGFHLAFTATFSSVVLVHTMGVKAMPRCFAILMFFGSFAKLSASPTVGWIYDMTDNYNYAYLPFGCFAFISGIMMIIRALLDRRIRKSTSKA